MKNVLAQAEKLAETILVSNEYQGMHAAEQAVMRDAEATQTIALFMEKRQQVESILADNDLDHGALAKAGEELEAAEKVMNELALLKTMQEARNEFTQMMQNVNQIIRLVVTGETEEAEESGGCSGSCSSCSGCH